MSDDRRAQLRADGIAGLTTAAVVVPQARAYAAIAGLPVQLGLYAGLLPMAVYALLGTSRRLLAPLFDHLAQATLGAVVIVAAAGLVDLGALGRLADVRREDLTVAGVAALGVLTWGTMAGVAIGVALSYLLLLRLLGKPSVSVLGAPEGRWAPLSGALPQRRPGMAGVRVDLPVYWATARRVVEQLVAAVDAAPDPPQVLVLDWSDQPRPGSSLLAAVPT